MEFSNPIVAGEDLVRTAIKSPNYNPGVSGWIIRQDGTAEFQDLVARGDITAESVSVVTADGLIQINENNNLNGMTLHHNDVTDEDVPALVGVDSFGGLILRGTERVGLSDAFIDIGYQAPAGTVSEIRMEADRVTVSARVSVPNLEADGVNTSTDITGITSTSFVESDTECRTVMLAPASGIMVVNWGFRASNNTANQATRMSVEVATGSFGGTVLSAASTLRMAEVFNSTAARVSSYSQIYTGLPTSGALFIRCMYAVSGGTGAIVDRTFSVQMSL